MWFEGSYFQKLDTKIFDPLEIQTICKKSKQIQTRVLNDLLKGKNMKTFLKKNQIVITTDKIFDNSENLTSFHILPSKNKGTIPFVFDSDLINFLREAQNVNSL